jgi:hypothetical protein
MLAAAVLAGVAVGAVAAIRTAAIEPFVEWSTEFVGAPSGSGEIWNVKVETRGGPVMSVAIETPAGVRCVNGSSYGPLALDRGHRFRIVIDPDVPRPVPVKIVHSDHGRREYIVPVGEARR